MSDEADKAAADARRLLDCDGPHLRKWMSDDPLDFIATVHRVATLAVAPRFAPAPTPEPAQPYAPPEGQQHSRPPRKKW